MKVTVTIKIEQAPLYNDGSCSVVVDDISNAEDWLKRYNETMTFVGRLDLAKELLVDA